MGAVVSCIRGILQAIGRAITGIAHAIVSILYAIIDGILSVFDIIINCLTCRRGGMGHGRGWSGRRARRRGGIV